MSTKPRLERSRSHSKEHQEMPNNNKNNINNQYHPAYNPHSNNNKYNQYQGRDYYPPQIPMRGYPNMNMRDVGYYPYYQQYPPMPPMMGMSMGIGMGYNAPRRQFYRGGKPGYKAQPQNQNQKEENDDAPKDVDEVHPTMNDEKEGSDLRNEGESNNEKIKYEEEVDEGEKHERRERKVKCKKWPQCEDQYCSYVHPVKTCPFFPKCRFGDMCIYIHPNIPCTYGIYCERINCAYSHPAGANPGMGMYPNVMHRIQPYYKQKGVRNTVKDESNNQNYDTKEGEEQADVEPGKDQQEEEGN